MVVDELGRVTWQTTQTDDGSHPVQITIADNRGAEIELDYTLAVLVDLAAPHVNLAVSQNPIRIGSAVTFVVQATDDVAVETLALKVDGVAIALDRNGRVTFTSSQAGLFEAIATATDGAGNI